MDTKMPAVIEMCIRDRSPADRLTLETAKMIREDFLQQNAFVDEDAYSSYYKQFRLLDMVLRYDEVCRAALPQGADVNALFDIPSREKIGRAKMVPPDDVDKTYDAIIEEMKAEEMCIRDRRFTLRLTDRQRRPIRRSLREKYFRRRTRRRRK